MNSDNFTDQEIVRLSRECIIQDDFTTFSTTLLSCRRRDGKSVQDLLSDIELAILTNGAESEYDKFRQFRMSLDGAAGELAEITGTSKHEVMTE